VSNLNQSLRTVILGTVAGLAGAYLFTLIHPANLGPGGGLGGPAVQNVSLTGYQPAAPGGSDPPRLPANGEVGFSFTEASRVSTPSVVYIKTSALNQRPYTWFDMFFDQQPRYDRQIGSGSGVIFSKDGYVVTNNHVIAGATEVQVIHQKRTYVAKLVGADPSSDLALLKIEADNLPAIKIASSEPVQVGDWVLAVGNPFNLASTVTAGIVSAKGRNVGILEGNQFPIESFIQTDAAINPGNSGGALVNLRGELVGINTAILSRTGSYTGYGFAVPSDIVVKIINDLKTYGQVQKAFLGLDVTDVSEEIYRELNLSEIEGVYITYIEQEGAAEQAGLKRGDVILKINSKPTNSKTAFDEQVSYYKPGDKVTVQFKRNGQVQEKQLQLTNLEGTTSVFKKEVFRAKELGADLEQVPKAERARLGIDTGVRIVKVNGGLIQRMGIPAGFVVTTLNNKPIASPEELTEILTRVKGQVILKGITREGQKENFVFNFY
jgi:serine protease Do